MGKAGCLPIDVILESLRAAKRSALMNNMKKNKTVVRVLLADDTARPATRSYVEESGMVDILIDGEMAVSMAALAWMEKTPYATSWAALAAERARGKPFPSHKSPPKSSCKK